MLWLAGSAGITRAEANEIIEQVSAAVAQWPEIAGEAGVSDQGAVELTKQLVRIRLN